MQRQTFFYQMQLVIPIAASLALGVSTQAYAASLGVASDYNVFTLGNFTQTSTDVEGKLAVGGNATFTGGFGVGSHLSSNTGNVLVTGGNLNLNNGQVNHGNVVYGGTANVSGVGFPNGTLSKGNPIDFNAAGDYLKGLSSYLAGLTPTATTTVQAWGAINLSGNSSSLNIFNLSGAALSKTNYFEIANAGKDSTVVVNVSGKDVSMKNFGFNIGGISRQNVLYNFYEATSLDVSGIGIEGSILAPLAALNFNNGQINGNVIAGSVTGNGESHNYLFNGALPNMPSTSRDTTAGNTGGGAGSGTVAKVPEPSTLLGLGLVSSLLGVVRRKGRQIKA
ncbi:choice-of-anchor A family protein [Argonema antarcticum]|uniref:choice-of-anchor A family protein n=1 Tax=Argonema antarcticum TaxID=2942763 RepID=UPI002013BE51|nr:choice-of-anchor A family protein [Argonema antarcticum]MCL1470828.1 choice-of-anchor A family protein [Argonema antarcticum A004/B2]